RSRSARPKSGGSAEPETVSGGLHVSSLRKGVRESEITDCDLRKIEHRPRLITVCDEFARHSESSSAFEITICDLKDRPWRSPLPSTCFHRARRRHAFKRAAQHTRGGSKHCDHAHIRAGAPANG